jgi:hypothetical protein
MKRAWVEIRDKPHYRVGAFTDGLKRLGFHVLPQQLPSKTPGPGDILVLWNRYGAGEAAADRWERAGGTVLVAENGYLGHDEHGVQMYALARHGHNGSGSWPVGGPERFARLRVEPRPWRAQGRHIYVRGQRGIGAKSMASPPGWHKTIAAQLKRLTQRPVIVREHPGQPANAIGCQIAHELAGAHACVIWSSAAGVRALVEGVPVFYHAPHWICAGAAKRGLSELESPLMDDAARLRALERMAWAQWSIAEIASGEPFARLLELQAVAA